MRSSRLVIRTTAAVLRSPRCTVPRSVFIPFQYACRRSFSDEKKTDEKANDDDMTITFTDSATEHAERKSSATKPTTIDISEFTHEVPIHMPDMGEGKGKTHNDTVLSSSYMHWITTTSVTCDTSLTHSAFFFLQQEK
jgi:hypothetical protein